MGTLACEDCGANGKRRRCPYCNYLLCQFCRDTHRIATDAGDHCYDHMIAVMDKREEARDAQ